MGGRDTDSGLAVSLEADFSPPLRLIKRVRDGQGPLLKNTVDASAVAFWWKDDRSHALAGKAESYGFSRQPRAITAVAMRNAPTATAAATTTETQMVASWKPVSPARVASTR